MGIKRLRPRSKSGRYSQADYIHKDDLPDNGRDVAIVVDSPAALPVPDNELDEYTIFNPVIEWQVNELAIAMGLLQLNESPPQLEQYLVAGGSDGDDNPIGCAVDENSRFRKRRGYFDSDDSEPPLKKIKIEKKGSAAAAFLGKDKKKKNRTKKK